MTRTLEATERKKVRMPDIDKVVVVTGASSGIGESTARLLARHRAKVVLGARRKDRLDAAVKEISAAGGKAISVPKRAIANQDGPVSRQSQNISTPRRQLSPQAMFQCCRSRRP